VSACALLLLRVHAGAGARPGPKAQPADGSCVCHQCTSCCLSASTAPLIWHCSEDRHRSLRVSSKSKHAFSPAPPAAPARTKLDIGGGGHPAHSARLPLEDLSAPLMHCQRAVGRGGCVSPPSAGSPDLECTFQPEGCVEAQSRNTQPTIVSCHWWEGCLPCQAVQP